MKRFVVVVGIVLLIITMVTSAVTGGCPSCGDNSPSQFSDTSSEEPTSVRPTNSHYENPGLITNTDELVIIVDVRSPEEYAEGHIPGAINLDWAKFRGAKGVFIGVENATRILGENGISQKNRVIVYCGSTTYPCTASPYVFWMLEYLGHENVSVLDGGFDAWCTLYGCTKDVTIRPPTTYTANLTEVRFADTEWVQNHLNNPMVQIVDARTVEEYNAGHIDGAINLNFVRLFGDGNRLKDADELEYLLASIGGGGLNKSKDTVVYCWSGASSSFLYFALRLMGYQVRNYDGSWNIWSETHPVSTL